MSSPRPEEPDVHLSMFLHSARFEFAACVTAALLFVQEWRTIRSEEITVLPGHPHGLSRLPCERLFLEP